MAVLDVTKKLHIYHTLYRLNRSFSAIVAYCRILQDAGIFKRKFARLFQGFAQELQSEVNEELLEIMQDIEQKDLYRFGKIRQARERELKDPNDVLIEAEKRKKELRKQSKRKA